MEVKFEEAQQKAADIERLIDGGMGEIIELDCVSLHHTIVFFVSAHYLLKIRK